MARLMKFSQFFLLIFSFSAFAQNEGESDTYIVKIRSGVSTNPTIRSMVRSANAEAVSDELFAQDGVNQTITLNRVGVVLVSGEEETIQQTLEEHPLVEYFEKDIPLKRAATKLDGVQDSPSAQALNPWLNDLMGLSATDADYDVDVPDPANSTIVAVVDDGVKRTNPFLTSAMPCNSTDVVDGIDNDSNGYTDDYCGVNVIARDGSFMTGSSHGSHVAGLIKAVRDQAIELGYTNAAKVRILPIKFISGSSGTTSGAILGLNYALAKGAKVVNASWGSAGFAGFSQALFDTMSNLYYNDVVIVAAAGNSSSNNDTTPYFPASFKIPALISVGSLNPVYSGGTIQSAGRSSFSNFGVNSVDLMAVGSHGGGGIWSAKENFGVADNLYLNQGTSMASPLVAGVAAVIRAINPSLTNYDVKTHIVNYGTTTSSGSFNGAVATKTGKRVNAGAAFAAAASAVSAGSRPGISGEAYYNQASAPASGSTTSSSSGSSSGGGCGLIADASQRQGPGEGPLGGNSLGLISLAYALFVLSRRHFNSTGARTKKLR